MLSGPEGSATCMVRCGIPGSSPKYAPAMRHAAVTETVTACVVGDCIDRRPTACGGSLSSRVWGVVTPLTCYVSSGDGFPVRLRDTASVPPCPSGQMGMVEGRVVSPSQVRILVAACRIGPAIDSRSVVSPYSSGQRDAAQTRWRRSYRGSNPRGDMLASESEPCIRFVDSSTSELALTQFESSRRQFSPWSSGHDASL